jgi:hypothetical protein
MAMNYHSSLHKILLLNSTMGQINPIHALRTRFLTLPILLLIIRLRLSFPDSLLFSQDFRMHFACFVLLTLIIGSCLRPAGNTSTKYFFCNNRHPIRQMCSISAETGMMLFINTSLYSYIVYAVQKFDLCY